jgi:hypothetical protein
MHPSRGSVEWSHGGALRAEPAHARAKMERRHGSFSLPAASCRTTRAKARSSSTGRYSYALDWGLLGI